MTPRDGVTPEDKAEEIADKIVEKSRKRWIEETEEGFGCNLDLLAKDIVYEVAEALKAAREEGRREGLEVAARVSENYSSNEELLHEAFKVVAEHIRKLKKGTK